MTAYAGKGLRKKSRELNDWRRQAKKGGRRRGRRRRSRSFLCILSYMQTRGRGRMGDQPDQTERERERERGLLKHTSKERENMWMKKITKHFAQEKKGPFVVKCWLIVLIYFSNVCQCFTVGRDSYPHSHIFSQQFSPSGSVISLLAFLSVSGIAQ